MGLGNSVLAFFTDPSYGIPLTISVVLLVGIGWWSLRRSAPLPTLKLGAAPESWRLQLDALVYANLRQGRYSAAVDALGRCLAVAVRDRFQKSLGDPGVLDDPDANSVFPAPMTLRTLVRDLERAHVRAAWAEQPSWFARQSGWLRRREERKAARDFALISTRVVLALDLLEAS